MMMTILAVTERWTQMNFAIILADQDPRIPATASLVPYARLTNRSIGRLLVANLGAYARLCLGPYPTLASSKPAS